MRFAFKYLTKYLKGDLYNKKQNFIKSGDLIIAWGDMFFIKD